MSRVMRKANIIPFVAATDEAEEIAERAFEQRERSEMDHRQEM